MRTTVWFLLSVFLIIGIVASCAPSPTPTPQVITKVVTATPPPPPPAVTKTKVALLLPGPLADGGWNMLAYQSVGIMKDGGFDVAYVENLPVADMPNTARGYATDGYNLIVAHGTQFTSGVMQLAAEFPKASFFVTGLAPANEKIPANVQFIDPQYHYGGFMAGTLAALVSKTHVVGTIGGADNPTQRMIANAFVQGAEQAVAGTKAFKVITGDYNDAAKGREAALTMIGNGADVIFHWANVTGLGALMGCIESKKICIGVYSDQTGMAWNQFASSLTMDLGGVIASRAVAVRDGKFEGGTEWKVPFTEVFKFKAGEGRFNPAYVSKEIEARLDQIAADVLSGKITVDRNTNYRPVRAACEFALQARCPTASGCGWLHRATAENPHHGMLSPAGCV